MCLQLRGCQPQSDWDNSGNFLKGFSVTLSHSRPSGHCAWASLESLGGAEETSSWPQALSGQGVSAPWVNSRELFCVFSDVGEIIKGSKRSVTVWANPKSFGTRGLARPPPSPSSPGVDLDSHCVWSRAQFSLGSCFALFIWLNSLAFAQTGFSCIYPCPLNP